MLGHSTIWSAAIWKWWRDDTIAWPSHVSASNATRRVASLAGCASMLVLPFGCEGRINQSGNPVLWTVLIVALVAGLFAFGVLFRNVRSGDERENEAVDICLRAFAVVGALGLALFAWVAFGMAGPRFAIPFLAWLLFHASYAATGRKHITRWWTRAKAGMEAEDMNDSSGADL